MKVLCIAIRYSGEWKSWYIFESIILLSRDGSWDNTEVYIPKLRKEKYIRRPGKKLSTLNLGKYLSVLPDYGLWKPKVQFRIHKISPIILILSQISPIPHIDTCFFKYILISSPHPFISLSRGLFPVKTFKWLLAPFFLTTWPSQPNRPDLITLTNR